ncbi:AzlD domain-containing protein [Cytobacillus gottheilii]|uniref:AzlD domain-containing protein n=1 Tax=Cytobacillus gottheilii TaxID=859144 RepID=UPI0009BAC3C3|nr:AzlD domain-containing protein [Cytobacillus gottheilii]
MNSEIMWMIIGMGVVTYLPRLLPFILFKGAELPAFVQGVLKNVPYATLGALIFPGVLFIGEDIWFGLLGACAAFLLAYIGVNVIFVVLGSIACLAVYSYLI